MVNILCIDFFENKIKIKNNPTIKLKYNNLVRPSTIPNEDSNIDPSNKLPIKLLSDLKKNLLKLYSQFIIDKIIPDRKNNLRKEYKRK